MIGLGIDTGGTCTDSVLFDTKTQQVLSMGKTLTTKNNLVIGINEALGQLDLDLLSKVQFVSLSTTLATNACIENRGGKVKLIMIGHLPKNKKEICQTYGFENEDDVYFLEGMPKGGYCTEKEPDWQKLESDIDFFKGCDAIGIVQAYPEWNNKAFEKKASEILKERYTVPIICGSSLFSDINAYQRGAGTYLNARLISVIEEFLKAVQTVLKNRKLNVPIYIMRSDGSLMSEAFAKSHPVETLLCGPAASTMGGMFGQNSTKALVIDMGGTTTDVAIVEEYMPVTIQDGIKINGWKTFVKGLYIDTFGLGGDTCVRYESGKIYLEPFRVTPISYVGTIAPDIVQRILNVSGRHLSKSEYYHEGFTLQKGLIEGHHYTEGERKICEALQDGPLLVHEIGERLHLQVKALPIKRLELEGAIMRFGLTPTDIMHIKGDYTPYKTEAVQAALTCFSHFGEIDKQLIPDMIYQEVKNKLYHNLIRILMEYAVPEYKEGIPEDLHKWLRYSCQMRENEILASHFQTEYDFIGVGAPTHVFLPTVAKWMGTEYICHSHAKAANALGTLVGQVSVKRQMEITYQDAEYKLIVNGKTFFYEKLEEAEAKAKEHLKEETKKIALERGVIGEVSYREKSKYAQFNVYGSNLILSTIVEVVAYGNILPEE